MKELFRRLCLFPILTVAVAVAGLAQQPAQISAERLRDHIRYLASEELEGRRTGTRGANDAADYIATEFFELGLKPAFQTVAAPRTIAEARANYRQKFPYVAGSTRGSGNELILRETLNGTTKSLSVGNDWVPLGLSMNSRLENTPAIFAGYGISAADMKYDDYASVNTRGNIAIAFWGTPDGDNPHGNFARYEDVRWKAIAARNAGARALILIAPEDPLRENRLSTQRNDKAGDAGLPIAVISRPNAARLLGLENTETLARMERSASSWVLGGGPSTNCKEPCGVTHNFKTPIGYGITLATDIIRREVPAANVIGILEGSDPKLKNEAIVIGAHYDHLGRGGVSSLARREGEVHHGADDNASGVAGILELAREFMSRKNKPRRSIVFIAFSGEEEGLLGSNYYVNHPVASLANTIAMINLDMIGRLKNRNLIIGGVGTATEWRSMIESANIWQGMRVNVTGARDQNGGAAAQGMPVVVAANGQPVVTNDSSKMFLLTLNDDGFGPSDHASFYGKQIPVLFFWTGTHADYHKPSDTAEKIDYEGEAQILTMVARIVRDVDASDKRPTFSVARAAASGRTTGFRVYLGTIPNYADSKEGLLLDGVRDDSPAAKAGLKAGDRVVKLAGRDVRDVYDYTAALGEMKAGQEYEIEVVRGTERLKLTLVPAARRQ